MKIMNYKYTQHGTYKHNAERKKLVVSIKFKKRRHGTVLLEIKKSVWGVFWSGQ